MSATQATGERWALREGADAAQQSALAERIAQALPAAVTRFAPKDDDALYDALLARKHDVVLLADLDALLEMQWKGFADVAAWEAADVRIELARRPCDDPAACRALLRTISASHRRWQGRQRRRQVVAACVLSAMVIAAAVILLRLIPPPR